MNKFFISPEIYSPEKEKANKTTVWEYYFARKVAFFIAPVFLKFGITANFTSFLSLGSGVIGTILITFGNFWLILAGGLLMQVWLILDKTDGIIARSNKRTTKFGEFFEELNGSLVAVLFFVSIGFAAARYPGFIPSFFKIHPPLFMLLGVFTSLFVAARHLIARHFEVIFREGKNGSAYNGGGLIAGLYGFTVKFSGVYSLAQIIFLLALVFNFLGLYTITYFLIQGALMLANTIYLSILASKK